MSYALRNTLILLTTLILMGVGGWLYMTYAMDSTLIDQEREISQKQSQLNQLTTKASDYVMIQDRHTTLKYRYENHNKELLENNDIATVFEYLRRINEDHAATVMNFSLQDSVLRPDHGILQVRLDGTGPYRNFFNFLTILEQSKPIARITNLRVAPVTEIDRIDDINFEMNIHFYYARGNTRSDPDLLIISSVPERIHNPMHALVHESPPNISNLPEVDVLRVIGLSASGIYIIDQNGAFKFLPTGSQVYLGRLTRVNLNNNTATFDMNRGGIRETLTKGLSPRP